MEIAKKEKKVKEPKVKVLTVELVSYSIKAVIPTGSYANIQPEIIVKAKNLEEASAFVLPHIDMLYRKYAPSLLPVVDLKKEIAKPTVITTGEIKPESFSENTGTTISVSAPFMKAEQAIGSCLSPEALQLIESQISKSVKLNNEEKFALLKLVEIKATELNK